ncbi:ABC transporter substrate-binding protein [Georgenia sp. Z1344]|uniref:ABC transporter substrate-binding protein n=1 Tax=Georgenia sp. Z1344 TaxID=3416706 RepID=UPI003CF1054E
MASSRVVQGLGLLAGASLVLTACGGDDSETDSQTITLGFPGTIGPTDTPIIAALNSLGEEGWDVEYIEFDSPDVQTQALMGGDINVASMGPATVMAADEGGAELTMVGNNNILDYLIVGSADVETCADLDGRTVAYHSEGSTSTAHLRRYLEESCPEAEPEFVVISGSSNRVTALLDGQIDGTIVRVEDWMSVEPDESVAHVIDNLVETQADLLTQTIVVDGAQDGGAAEAASALLAALEEQFAAVNEDPAAFAETAAEILESEPAEVQTVLEALVENGTFPETPELDPASVDATIGFYREAEVIGDELNADAVADFEVAGGGSQ